MLGSCTRLQGKRSVAFLSRIAKSKADVRVSALGTAKKTTPFSAARSATCTSSPFSFLSVSVGRDPPMSMWSSAGVAATASASAGASAAFAFVALAYKREKSCID